MRIRVDDLSGEATRSLIAHHLADMRATSPEESCHALDVDALREPAVTFWSAWDGDDLAGIAALKDLGAARGELKSMRVADAHRGRGVGRALLHHVMGAARARGLSTLWLETGTPPAFLAARRLYADEGFTECGPFGDYVNDPFSVFMMRLL
ncbi:putative acetyltransferase [Microbacterium thalassium]|uniref:Putative acetyltransferase n=1 Tax=Microbacterium thalassium TaxID=362649 RepID=A0A7X0FRW2_9MICO|nr:GNAT family N-acetyltransferase [Microbacterium thalassium]MBB6392573.1 putative acetyltransferase [Microbacterium thalassium]GLK23196.1 N-acetyltransferase [Microbacterium thalassium]